MSRWSGTLWEFYAQSAALCSTLSEVKRCWAVGPGGRCCNTRAGALMGTSVWDLLRGTLIKHDLLKPGWIINPFSVDALPYLDYAWPYEEVWERLLFILHYIECQNSATGLAKQSSLAEKGWLRRSFCLWIPSIPIQAAAISNLALILHSWSCTNLSLRRRLCNMLGIFLQSQHSFKIWTILHISIETSENILQF